MPKTSIHFLEDETNKLQNEFQPLNKRIKLQEEESKPAFLSPQSEKKSSINGFSVEGTQTPHKTLRTNQESIAMPPKLEDRVDDLICGMESWSLTGLKQWRNKMTSESTPEKLQSTEDSIALQKKEMKEIIKAKQKETRRQMRLLRTQMRDTK